MAGAGHRSTSKSKDRFRNSPPAGAYVKHFDFFTGTYLMKPLLSFAVVSILLTGAPRADAQDITQGRIVALDRVARLLVLEDRSVWSLELMKSEISADLKAGDRIEIIYQSDEDGVNDINSVIMLPPKAPEEGAPNITEGTVLVYDRKAQRLVLTDRSVWDLASLKAEAPAGLEAGNRVHIEFEADEDGVTAINSITTIMN
jgi:hypothetical protein